MNDKSWAFFGLTILLAVLGFVAGMNHEDGVAVFCAGGTFCSGVGSWVMTTY